MAKGNPYWGKQRGKLGETVLSVVNGQQIQRVYNSQPRNPRSTAQTEQRAIFATAVKFYKHATQQYFKFAFESKKQNESDFNAFMRLNAKNGMIVSREQYNENNYPAIGHFMLSQGSLPSVEYLNDDPDTAATEISLPSIPETPTLGDLATGLANQYGLQNGDIITIIRVSSSLQDIEDMPSAAPRWRIIQTIVGDNDARTLASVENQISMTLSNPGGAGTKYLNIDMNYDGANAVAITFSRNTSSGVKVSDTYLQNNQVAETIFNDSLRAAFRDAALNSWKRSGTALLKGALADATQLMQFSGQFTTAKSIGTATDLVSSISPRIESKDVVEVTFTGGTMDGKKYTIGDGATSSTHDNVKIECQNKATTGANLIIARHTTSGTQPTFNSFAVKVNGLELVQA